MLIGSRRWAAAAGELLYNSKEIILIDIYKEIRMGRFLDGFSKLVNFEIVVVVIMKMDLGFSHVGGVEDVVN